MVTIKKWGLYKGDCLQILPKLAEKGFKADMVLTDPPWAATNEKWDTIIPLNSMWKVLKQVTRNTTPVLLFGQNPFIAELILSNKKEFKFNFVWDKHNLSNPFLTKYMPSKVHEEIAVFYNKQPTFNPQRVPRKWGDQSRTSECDKKIRITEEGLWAGNQQRYYEDDGFRHPQTIISHVSSQTEECVNSSRYHPTQKPIKLLKHLIKMYSNKEDLILDFTCGSGSTGVASIETGRKFVGIELESKYYNISKQRLITATEKTEGIK